MQGDKQKKKKKAKRGAEECLAALTAGDAKAVMRQLVEAYCSLGSASGNEALGEEVFDIFEHAFKKKKKQKEKEKEKEREDTAKEFVYVAFKLEGGEPTLAAHKTETQADYQKVLHMADYICATLNQVWDTEAPDESLEGFDALKPYLVQTKITNAAGQERFTYRWNLPADMSAVVTLKRAFEECEEALAYTCGENVKFRVIKTQLS